MLIRLGIERTAAAALILFYAVGLGAHLFSPTRALMTLLTPYVLLACGAAVLAVAGWAARPRPVGFAAWCAIVIAGTFAAEVLGVRTGMVFGGYGYGRVLGVKAAGVPLVIGFNWALVVLGASFAAERILAKLRRASPQPPIAQGDGAASREARGGVARSICARGAGLTFLFALLTGLLAALFDWAMEPAAVALGYWSWEEGAIPLRNYAAWFVLAGAAALLYRGFRLRLASGLPIVYLVIQWCFFLGLDVGLVGHIS